MEPRTWTIVASAHFCPRLRRRSSSSKTSIPHNYSWLRGNDLSMTTTPILDLEKDPPKRRRVMRGLLLQGAVGVLIGLLLVMAPTLPGTPSPNFLIWIVAVHLMILLHEAGHLVAGHLAGLPPGGIRVGCFTLIRSGDRWIFRFDPAGFASGMAIPLPREGEGRISSLVWMVAGGPIVSIVSMAVCWVAWSRFGDGTWDWIGSFWWPRVRPHSAVMTRYKRERGAIGPSNWAGSAPERRRRLLSRCARAAME